MLGVLVGCVEGEGDVRAWEGGIVEDALAADGFGGVGDGVGWGSARGGEGGVGGDGAVGGPVEGGGTEGSG